MYTICDFSIIYLPGNIEKSLNADIFKKGAIAPQIQSNSGFGIDAKMN